MNYYYRTDVMQKTVVCIEDSLFQTSYVPDLGIFTSKTVCFQQYNLQNAAHICEENCLKDESFL